MIRFFDWLFTVLKIPKRCPQCSGEGKYASEGMARYGDEPITCPMCKGMGKIKK